MFADPTVNLGQFEIGPGMQVADFGAGSGFYTLAAARLLGGSGKVFAIDVQKDLLDRVKNNALAHRIHNVEVVWGDLEKEGGSRLRDLSVDRVIASNILFQLDDKESFVKEIHRILKAYGKVLVIDWNDASSISGPDRNHVLQETAAIDLFEKAGFSFEKSIRAGAHHYGFIVSKK